MTGAWNALYLITYPERNKTKNKQNKKQNKNKTLKPFRDYRLLFLPAESLFISCVTYGLLLNSAMPIYYEMTVEGVYPVAEGIATGAINWLYNLTGLIFLFVMLIPDIGMIMIGLYTPLYRVS